MKNGLMMPWKGLLVFFVLLALGCEGTQPLAPSESQTDDDTTTSNTQTVTVVITCPGGCGGAPTPATDNRPPVLDILTSQTNQQGTTIVGIQIRATDPDGDTLTFSAAGLPRGLTINGASGVISGTITSSSANDSPFFSFVRVTDGPLADSGTFIWTVTP